MTNAHTPPHNNDNSDLYSTQKTGRPVHSVYLTRRSHKVYWHVALRTATTSRRTGTTDEDQARAIAATILALCGAAPLVLDTISTDERTRVLLEGIEQVAARRRQRSNRQRANTSGTKAEDGQFEIRKPRS